MSRVIPIVGQALLAATLAVVSSALCADDLAASFRGYGTVGGTLTDNGQFSYRGNNDFDPGTEWLYAQYQPRSDWSVRLGRVLLPSFLYSEVIDVGYAAPWFRAPNEVYEASGIDYLDGAQVQWQHSFASVRLDAEFSYGTGQTQFEFGGTQVTDKANSLWNAAVAVIWNDLRRAGGGGQRGLEAAQQSEF